MWSTEKWYFFHHFNTREGSPWQIESMEPKTNCQSQNTESSILHFSMLNALIFLTNTTKFLDLATAPTCNSHNHTAMTLLHVPLSLHPDSLSLRILRPPFPPSWWALSWWSMPYPASFFWTFPISLVHILICGAALTATVSYFWSCQKEAKGGLVGYFIHTSSCCQQSYRSRSMMVTCQVMCECLHMRSHWLLTPPRRKMITFSFTNKRTDSTVWCNETKVSKLVGGRENSNSCLSDNLPCFLPAIAALLSRTMLREYYFAEISYSVVLFTCRGLSICRCFSLGRTCVKSQFRQTSSPKPFLTLTPRLHLVRVPTTPYAILIEMHCIGHSSVPSMCMCLWMNRWMPK